MAKTSTERARAFEQRRKDRLAYLEKLYWNARLEANAWGLQLTEAEDSPKLKTDRHKVYDLRKKYYRALGYVEAYANAVALMKGTLEMDTELNGKTVKELAELAAVD
jgi:hypothetical protein